MIEIFVAVNNHCFPKKESSSFQEYVINIEEMLESEPTIGIANVTIQNNPK